jgi:hypothetical protein
MHTLLFVSRTRSVPSAPTGLNPMFHRAALEPDLILSPLSLATIPPVAPGRHAHAMYRTITTRQSAEAML